MTEISNIRKMELHQIIDELEKMSLEDMGRTLFWLAGYISEQDREIWDKFCKGIQSSPYYPS